MPGEVGGVGAQGCLGREEERAAVKVGKPEVTAAGEDGFGDIGHCNLDAQVVVDGPQACIKEIVGRRCQGQTVVRTVRTSLGVGMDVRRLKGIVCGP